MRVFTIKVVKNTIYMNGMQYNKNKPTSCRNFPEFDDVKDARLKDGLKKREKNMWYGLYPTIIVEAKYGKKDGYFMMNSDYLYLLKNYVFSINKRGYVVSSDGQYLHRMIKEKYGETHGKNYENRYIIFKDGNKFDCRIHNLGAVKNKIYNNPNAKIDGFDQEKTVNIYESGARTCYVFRAVRHGVLTQKSWSYGENRTREQAKQLALDYALKFAETY